MKFNLGKVSLMPRGEYDPLLTYAKLDIVTYQGSAYVVLKDDVVGIVPSNDKVNYFLLVEKGEPYTHSEEFEKLVASLAETETRVNEIKLAIEESAKKFAEDYDQKLQDFNSNHTQKLQAYNDNADLKIQSLEEKYDNFNKNANQKSQEYNDNAKLKVQEYNANHAQKVQEYNDNAVKANETIDLQIAKATQEANRAETNASKSEVLMRSVPKLRAEGNPILLDDAIEQKVMDVLPYISDTVVFAKGSTTQDGAPTSENPIEIKNAKITQITSVGKNLLKPPVKPYISESSGFPTLTISEKGLIKIIGLANQTGGRNTIKSFDFALKKGTYTVSYVGNKKSNLYLVNTNANENIIGEGSSENNITFNIDADCLVHFGLNVRKEDVETEYNDSFYIQIEKGSQATEYEPYKGRTVVFSEPIALSEFDFLEIHDGVVEKMNVTNVDVITDKSEFNFKYLPSVVVSLSKKGDFSRYLICNYLPKKEIKFSSNSAIGVEFKNAFLNFGVSSEQEFLSKLNQFYEAGNPLKIQYKAEKEVFEPLPLADQQAILNMIIQAPNSTIMTDTGITLSINYIADTKKWVLKQVNELNEKVLQTQKALLGGKQYVRNY